MSSGILRKNRGRAASGKIWEEKPAEIAEASAAEAQTAPESNAAESADGEFDMSDILKNLPESDSDLKAMIDELI